VTQSHPNPPAYPTPRPIWRIVWLALFVRIAYMTIAHTYRFRPYGDHFQYGWEMARIARAIVTGYGYSDPFNGHTGPTAWVTPAYPLIIAAIFKLTGVYTLVSAWLLLAINCVLSALIVRNTWEIANRCYGPSVALWSAWLWALYPAAMQYAVRWLWEMTLTAFLFTWVLVLALRMRGIGDPPTTQPLSYQTRSRWAIFGLLWGLIALANPAILIFLPVCGLWVLAGASRAWPRQLPNAALAALVCLALIAPWTYRNWRAFHHFIPMRGNFGAELYLGNGPGAVGLLMEYNHPGESEPQLRAYKQMGEVAYVAMRGAKAKAIIAQDKPRFLKLSLKRLYYTWFSVPHPADDAPLVEYGRSLNFQFTSLAGLLGLALALYHRKPAAGLFAAAFLLLPFMYYLVTAHARFRHPLEPLITILAVYLFQSAEKTWRIRPWRYPTPLETR
jgi:4-amino-4-deoxy-L-arabinose transferase-like glycosyltransferase